MALIDLLQLDSQNRTLPTYGCNSTLTQRETTSIKNLRTKKTVRALVSDVHMNSALKQLEVDEHARALEEQWIDSLDGGSSASLANSLPTVSSLHNGILLGFFFPLMPVFFFRATKPAVFWDDGSEHEALTPSIFS